MQSGRRGPLRSLEYGNRTRTGALLIVILLATFLRLFHLQQTPPGLYPDEAMNGNNALEALRTGGFSVFYPENNGREGLMIAIQALSLKAFGVREPWVLRAPSALIGVLTVFGIYLLGRESFSQPTGLLAAFLMATSTWHLYFSRMGFRAILAPLLAVWALYLFLAALRRAGAHERWITTAVAGGVVFGLGFYSYIAFRAMPLLFFVFLPWSGQLPGFVRVAKAFVATAFVTALPIGLYFLRNPDQFSARASDVSVFSEAQPWQEFLSNLVKTAGMLFFTGDANWRHNLSGRAELFWPVGSLLLAGIAVGCYVLARRKPQSLSYALMFGWLLLAILPVALSSEGVPHALRSILMLPPVLLLAAAGGEWASGLVEPHVKPHRVRRAIGLGVCAALAAEAYYTYFVRYANQPDVQAAFNADYVAIGRAIEQLPRDVTKVVMVEAGGLEVRGHRMPTQTVMFITDTFDPEMAKQRNIIYVEPDDPDPPQAVATFHLK